MLEIILLIAVVRAFVRTAKTKNLNGTAWGFIGALSYIIPVCIVWFAILPGMVESGSIRSQGQLLGMGLMMNFLAGFLGAMTAWIILKNQPSNVPAEKVDVNSQILDSGLTEVYRQNKY
ncbi:MAG TPA: hypothetical protein VK177_06360 [Flavobacteriales bacterium]|nr:hypothetical protein [Flavobacteriales bacterium]